MNRSIKFRAWHPKKNRMWSWKEIRDSSMRMHSFERNSHLIFMQYTGLEDRHGKEIYEGDVIKQVLLSGKEVRYAVRFVEGSFVAENLEEMYLLENTNETAVMLGNKFEDPDLAFNLEELK